MGQITQEFYNYKNLEAPKHGKYDSNIRTLYQRVEELSVNNKAYKKKVEFLEPLVDLKKEGQNLRESLLTYILANWENKYGDNFAVKKDFLASIDVQDTAN